MNCKVCGSVIGEGVIFCTSCGAKVDTQKESEVTTESVAYTAFTNYSDVEKALYNVSEHTEGMPAEMTRSEDEKLGDMMETADRMVGEYSANEAASVCFSAPVEVEGEGHVEKKVHVEAEKAAMELSNTIAKNSMASTIFNSILAFLFTGVLFMTASIFMLSHSNFDEFYAYEVFCDIYANIDFWVLTCSWYAIAMCTILVLLVLLMFFVLKKRKYAILNYIGIPLIVDGAVFLFISYFSDFITDVLEFDGIMAELFEVIGGVANEQIVLSSLMMMGIGIVAVFAYTVTAVTHKAIYRRKGRKAEK